MMNGSKPVHITDNDIYVYLNDGKGKNYRVKKSEVQAKIQELNKLDKQ